MTEWTSAFQKPELSSAIDRAKKHAEQKAKTAVRHSQRKAEQAATDRVADAADTLRRLPPDRSAEDVALDDAGSARVEETGRSNSPEPSSRDARAEGRPGGGPALTAGNGKEPRVKSADRPGRSNQISETVIPQEVQPDRELRTQQPSRSNQARSRMPFFVGTLIAVAMVGVVTFLLVGRTESSTVAAASPTPTIAPVLAEAAQEPDPSLQPNPAEPAEEDIPPNSTLETTEDPDAERPTLADTNVPGLSSDAVFTRHLLEEAGGFWTAEALAVVDGTVIAVGNLNTTNGFFGGLRTLPGSDEPIPILDSVTDAAVQHGDRSRFVTAHADGTIAVASLSETREGQYVATRLPGLTTEIDSVLFTSLGDVLAGSDSRVWRWRNDNGTWSDPHELINFVPLHDRLQSYSSQVFDLQQLPDGTLAARSGKFLVRFDQDGSHLQEFSSVNSLTSAIYLPDNSVLWSTFEGGLQLLPQQLTFGSQATSIVTVDSASGVQISPDHAWGIRASPDGELVLEWGDSVRLWRDITGTPNGEVVDNTAALSASDFTDSGFAISFFDGRIELWTPER